MITHPERKNAGGFRLRPTLAAKDVTNSIGHTVHQTRPRKTADRMINGHQYDQTIKLATFVFRSTLAKAMSRVLAANPPAINRTKVTSVSICSPSGNHVARNSLLIVFVIQCLFLVCGQRWKSLDFRERSEVKLQWSALLCEIGSLCG